ncbi:hypothetical protein, partial [Micrococcus luteus]|uniref:hypothetical protein n=1 Tax=Micrococcus luteus TaxID=1270 RepID=UPI00331AD520
GSLVTGVPLLWGAGRPLTRETGAVRIATSDRGAWPVERLAIGYQTSGRVQWWPVDIAWPDAAAWAAQTSRRRDVTRAWVDVPSEQLSYTTWIWEFGVQTYRRQEAVSA